MLLQSMKSFVWRRYTWMVNFDSDEFSYEVIMERMLDSVPLDIDKREGSVIYNALGPAAAELAQMYIWMDQILTLSFADTSMGEFLDLRAREVGIERFEPTHALYTVDITLSEGAESIPLGSRFSIDDYYFELVDNNVLRIETPGEAGNGMQDGTAILPLDTFSGLEEIKISGLLQHGTDGEDDENLRERYFVRVRREANSGNKEHYKVWAEEVEGVGLAKVFPLHNGPGTVKIVIVNSNYQSPIQTLVNDVQEHIDPVNEEGEGQAPIGSIVTVVGAISDNINIQADVELQINRNTTDAENELRESLSAYLRNNAFRLDYLNISTVSELLLACDSVRMYSNVRINGVADNYLIDPEVIATLNDIDLGLM